MAIAKTGAIIGSLSGNLSGANYCNSRFGLTVRRPKPPPPAPTSTQLRVTRAMQLARQWWRDITDEQRDAWRTFASNTLLRNRLGTQRNLTGQQLFIRYNFQASAFGLWRLDNPPTPWPFYWPRDFVLIATAGVSLIIAPSPAKLPGGDPFIVAGSRPVSTHPINHFSRWAIIALPVTVFGGFIDALADFEARFGTIQSGERIAVRIRYIDLTNPHFGWLEHATTVL